MAVNIMSNLKENIVKSGSSSPNRSDQEETVFKSTLRTTLINSNQFLITQIDKNKKFIRSLQSFFAWISSCPESINPELTSLMLSNSQPEETYDFELRLACEFNRYICKSKYFNLIVELVPLTGKVVQISEKIPVEVKLYTSESIPKPILTTMQGKNILRGRGVENLVYNGAEEKFMVRIKMQITEVSSHFVNGTVNLVVGKKDELGYSIKPLVLKDLIIKAKEKTCIRWREQES